MGGWVSVYGVCMCVWCLYFNNLCLVLIFKKLIKALAVCAVGVIVATGIRAKDRLASLTSEITI